MHRFKPLWSTFNSLHKTSGSNTLARSPSTSGPCRRCSHETKTSPPPHAPADEVLPANGGIGDDFAGGCIGYLLSRNRSPLSDLSRRALPRGSVARSTAPRSPYARLAGLPAVAQPATGHGHTRQLCDVPALYVG